MRVLGVDGWKGKWVAITLVDQSFDSVAIYQSLSQLVNAEPHSEVIGIDMPIGLTDSPPRKADQLARQMIGKRRSSVFDPPPRFCLDSKWNDYRKANQESQERCSRGISAQGFALMNLIRETAVITKQDNRFYEIHPEVCFRVIKGTPLDYSKKSWNGLNERLDLLKSVAIYLPQILEGPLGNIPPDDLLDAAVVAWSADRIARGLAESVPASDDRKAPKIWY